MDKQRQVETFNKQAQAYDNRRKKKAQATWRQRLLQEASGMENIQWLEADIDSLELSEQSYDTIVSTLSLCSYEHPRNVLQQMNRWCRPTGRILLMEHGASANPLVSAAQRITEPIASRISGCHHTRDILGEIRVSGIRIERFESHWMGMVHLIWARPG